MKRTRDALRQTPEETPAAALLDWFDRHGRKDLPWQGTSDPYRVWISEIMLQQTQVVTVIPYYQRFMARFPDVASLAAAPIDDVLHLWSGLGYYARGRNLHRAAQLVQERHGGRLPADIDELQTLPGIGRSTAGAILALALDQRHPILDGNVKRVLTRYHAIDEWPGRTEVLRRLWLLADEATPSLRVRDYTQAIMDLGATLCTRTRPGCERCPLAAGCAARRTGRPASYPRSKPRADKPARDVTVLLLNNDAGEILLQRRPPTGIWGGLWSLPELPPETAADEHAIDEWCARSLGLRLGARQALPPLRHEFTHFTLTLSPLQALAEALPGVMEEADRVWYNGALSGAYGMAAPIRRLIERR